MVQFDPEKRQLGLDVDEEKMVDGGITSSLVPISAYDAFNRALEARTATKHTKSSYERARDGDRLWVDLDGSWESVGGDPIDPRAVVAGIYHALSAYEGKHVFGRYLNCTPAFDPNSLEYKNALATHDKISNSLGDLERVLEQVESAPPTPAE